MVIILLLAVTSLLFSSYWCRNSYGTKYWYSSLHSTYYIQRMLLHVLLTLLLLSLCFFLCEPTSTVLALATVCTRRCRNGACSVDMASSATLTLAAFIKADQMKFRPQASPAAARFANSFASFSVNQHPRFLLWQLSAHADVEMARAPWIWLAPPS